MVLSNPFPGHTALTTFADLRRDLEGLMVRNSAGVMRAGVFPDHMNPIVTGRSDMKVNIGDFRAVQNRGGAVLLANVGTDTSVTLPAAPGANKRIDLIYVTMRSAALGDAASTPLFGFVQGTASATPVAPPLPANLSTAIPLATVEIPAGATTTLSAGVVITQVYPYTALAGGVVVVRNTVELAAWTPTDGAKAFCILDGGTYSRKGTSWVPSRRAVSITTDRAAFPTGFIDLFNLAVVPAESTDTSIISAVPATGNKFTVVRAGFYSLTWFGNMGTGVTANSTLNINRGASTLVHSAPIPTGASAGTLSAADVWLNAGDEIVIYANKVGGASANFSGKLVIAAH